MDKISEILRGYNRNGFSFSHVEEDGSYVFSKKANDRGGYYVARLLRDDLRCVKSVNIMLDQNYSNENKSVPFSKLSAKAINEFVKKCDSAFVLLPANGFFGEFPAEKVLLHLSQEAKKALIDKAPHLLHLDNRYVIAKEFTGHISGKPQYVARFLGAMIGIGQTKNDAKALAAQHSFKRI